jgi:predicted metal-binding protein
VRADPDQHLAEARLLVNPRVLACRAQAHHHGRRLACPSRTL